MSKIFRCASLLLALAALPAPAERLILRGVTVVDGTGAPPFGPVDLVIEAFSGGIAVSGAVEDTFRRAMTGPAIAVGCWNGNVDSSTSGSASSDGNK